MRWFSFIIALGEGVIGRGWILSAPLSATSSPTFWPAFTPATFAAFFATFVAPVLTTFLVVIRASRITPEPLWNLPVLSSEKTSSLTRMVYCIYLAKAFTLRRSRYLSQRQSHSNPRHYFCHRSATSGWHQSGFGWLGAIPAGLLVFWTKGSSHGERWWK